MTIDRFPVEASHVMMFARAIADPNPVYVDETLGETGRIPAPPTFAAAGMQFDPDAVLRPKPGEPWMGSGREPSSARAMQSPGREGGEGSDGGTSSTVGLHAEQHYEYHRPLYVGDVLHAKDRPGEQWTKEGRTGRLHFSESITEYFDEREELVLTVRSVGVLREASA